MSDTTSAKQFPENVRETVRNAERLSGLRSSIERNHKSDGDFDNLAQLAADLFDAPIALVSLVEEDVQWFQSCIGLDVNETEVSASFCAHAIAREELEPLVVLDAMKDERFAENRLVTGAPNIRFYCGYPLIVHGTKVGTLCVIDDKPRQKVEDTQIAALKRLAGLASSLFELKFSERQSALTEARLAERLLLSNFSNHSAQIANWIWYPATGMVESDQLLQDILGLQGDHEHTLEAMLSVVRPKDRKRITDTLISHTPESEDFEIEFANKAATRWFVMRGRSAPTAKNRNDTAVMGLLIETTETRNSNENKKLLLKELNHRVKNTLAILQSLSGQTMKHAKDASDYNSTFFGRLQSISQVHTLLTDEDWQGVELHELVEGQLKSASNNSEQVSVDLPEATLMPDQALGLGLIIHELLMHSVQTGSLLTEDGHVSITGDVNPNTDGKNVLIINWNETNGPQSQPLADAMKADDNFDLTLITRGLDKVIGSKVNVDQHQNGLHVSISFPL